MNPLIRTLRANGIEVTAIHSDMLAEQPRMFFIHRCCALFHQRRDLILSHYTLLQQGICNSLDGGPVLFDERFGSKLKPF